MTVATFPAVFAVLSNSPATAEIFLQIAFREVYTKSFDKLYGVFGRALLTSSLSGFFLLTRQEKIFWARSFEQIIFTA